jgi:hypothetical protein
MKCWFLCLENKERVLKIKQINKQPAKCLFSTNTTTHQHKNIRRPWSEIKRGKNPKPDVRNDITAQTYAYSVHGHATS